jgi:hypothetical protein
MRGSQYTDIYLNCTADWARERFGSTAEVLTVEEDPSDGEWRAQVSGTPYGVQWVDLPAELVRVTR